MKAVEGFQKQKRYWIVQQFCGLAPTNISDDGPGRYIVNVAGPDDDEKLMLLNERFPTKGRGNCKLKVTLLQEQLTCDKIVHFVQMELELRGEYEVSEPV